MFPSTVTDYTCVSYMTFTILFYTAEDRQITMSVSRLELQQFGDLSVDIKLISSYFDNELIISVIYQVQKMNL